MCDLSLQVVAVLIGQILEFFIVVRILSSKSSAEEGVFFALETILLAKDVNLVLQGIPRDATKRVADPINYVRLLNRHGYILSVDVFIKLGRCVFVV